MNIEIAKKLDSSVLPVITDKQIGNFEKGFQTSAAIVNLKGLLTADVMKDIMALQGSTLGFKTDKDDKGGYPLEVVRNCVIDASLQGLPLTGNHFNIIGGNVYATKNGVGKQLKDLTGLKYDITFDLPRINSDKTSAAIKAKVKWDYKGEKDEKEIELPIRMNAYMGVDAILGKAKRKARAWLYETITGYETPEGEVTDVAFTVVQKTITIEQLQELFDEVLPVLDEKNPADAALIKNAERILKNNETESFAKIEKELRTKIG